MRLRLIAGKIAAIRRIIKLDQRIAGLHCHSGLEEYFGNTSADLRVDRDLVNRGGRPDAGGKARHCFGFDLDCADLRWGWPVVGEKGRNRLTAKPIKLVKPT